MTHQNHPIQTCIIYKKDAPQGQTQLEVTFNGLILFFITPLKSFIFLCSWVPTIAWQHQEATLVKETHMFSHLYDLHKPPEWESKKLQKHESTLLITLLNPSDKGGSKYASRTASTDAQNWHLFYSSDIITDSHSLILRGLTQSKTFTVIYHDMHIHRNMKGPCIHVQHVNISYNSAMHWSAGCISVLDNIKVVHT